MRPQPGTPQETDGDARLTPVMRQYQDFKAQYPDAILLFRIGDFYETFGDDAELISRELEIVLTSRSRSGDQRIPLAGVPFHAAEGYIAKLVGKGYKVAVVDQVGETKNKKGGVRRELARVVTPGTVIDPAMLPPTDSSSLLSLCPDKNGKSWGVALLDISTAEFSVSVIDNDPGNENILSEISRYHPSECIVPSQVPAGVLTLVRDTGVAVTIYRDEEFAEPRSRRTLMDHFHVASLAGYGCEHLPPAVGAAGAALAYARQTQNSSLSHITALSMRSSSQEMALDAITLRNLEIRESIHRDAKGPTLFSCLNLTKTPMGSRLLNRRLLRPLTDPAEINRRLDAVDFFAGNTACRLSLRSKLAQCIDLERVAARIAYGNAGPRDLVALADTLSMIPGIRDLVNGEKDLPNHLVQALQDLRELPGQVHLIRAAIIEDPPAVARNGGFIRAGYSEELDRLHEVLHSGKDWILALQQKERERTGIKSLKIGYNRIFGYYIDVTKPNLHLVPPGYQRRQTTAGGERFTLPELQEKETLLGHADERILSLEGELYTAVVESLRAVVPDLQGVARGMAVLDVASSLAEVARTRDYVRPVLNSGDSVVIRDGRHPVVEAGLPGSFVPNDTELAGSGTQIMIITGANMAGKSTYMRGVAQICIMAQAGCFVPARHATIGIIDRIFTRVGAFDDLASGQSTFFVEMSELANILNNVTHRSLVILDEIGRGTSTVDGYSIAKAVLEYLHGKGGAGPKTLFATHFHDIIGMEGVLKRVKNYHFAVRETEHEVVFLRKLIPGATDKSYGIHVARLAGIPGKVTDRAEAILADTMTRGADPANRPRRYTQILLVDPQTPPEAAGSHPVLEELSRMKPDEMTPLEALAKIADLRRRLNSGRDAG